MAAAASIWLRVGTNVSKKKEKEHAGAYNQRSSSSRMGSNWMGTNRKEHRGPVYDGVGYNDKTTAGLN